MLEPSDLPHSIRCRCIFEPISEEEWMQTDVKSLERDGQGDFGWGDAEAAIADAFEQPRRYTRRPTTFEAIQWDGTEACVRRILRTWPELHHCWGGVPTLMLTGQAPGGPLMLDPGDWLIKDEAGMFHRGRQATFASSYEEMT